MMLIGVSGLLNTQNSWNFAIVLHATATADISIHYRYKPLNTVQPTTNQQ